MGAASVRCRTCRDLNQVVEPGGGGLTVHGEIQKFAALSHQRPEDRQRCADAPAYLQAPTSGDGAVYIPAPYGAYPYGPPVCVDVPYGYAGVPVYIGGRFVFGGRGRRFH